MVTCVLNSNRHVVDIVLLINLGIAIFERGIAKTESEGIAHGYLERVEIPIAYIDILLIVGIVHILHIAALHGIHEVNLSRLIHGEIT